MSQQDQHLTTEQLSALLDQQLSPEEQAACSAHLVDCEQCQYALDNLQLTVNLLQSLPMLEVPRSFALPTDFKIASDANPYDNTNWIDYNAETQVDENEHAATKKKSSPRRLSTPFRQTLRTVSALAAVVGLFLALSGLPIGGSSAGTTSAPAFSSANKPASSVTNGSQSKAQGLPNGDSTSEGSSNTTTTPGVSNQSTRTAHQPSNPNNTNKQPPPATATASSTVTWLPLIDFTQPGIRLSIGILLAILGWMGYRLFTRQQR